MNARTDRTAIRLKLYENGFTPLANRNKMSLIKGWSTFDVTPDMIRSKEWARSRLQDTGLRCGDIIALDWDIDDGDLMNALLDALVEQGVIADSPFVRIGKAPRELWVYRTRDKIGKRTTGHFMPADAADDFGNGYAVEVLGKGCQFAAFGQRDETTAYTWPVESPLDHVYMDLPEITLAQCDAVVAFAAQFFEQHGLVRHSPGGGTDSGYSHVYDLTEDMVFEVKDVGTVGFEELLDILHANPEETLRCKADVFRPTSGSWACMASLSGGDLCVSDHGTYTAHFPAGNDASKGMESLGQLIAKRLGLGPVDPETARAREVEVNPELPRLPLDPTKTFDENLQIALDRYVYVERDNMICDLLDTSFAMVPQHFRDLAAPHYTEEAGVRGARKVVRLADQWLQHPKRRQVKTVALRPDMPAPLYHEDGHVHLNTYRKVTLPETGEPRPGFEFLERLLPIGSERRYFIQWLSQKVIDPSIRGPGIIMVAHNTYGTGRGSLVEMLRRMFSPGLVRNISFDILSGRTYQSQYNEWLSDSLIVAVDEAQETTTSVSRWQQKSNAYEKLKEIVDPGTQYVDVVRKGRANGPGRTFASILVMTNHMDSLVLPENDRRFFICENGTPQSVEYWTQFHAWLDKPENVGAFIARLRETDLAGYSPYAVPPMTAAKADMVESNQSEMDHLLETALAQFVDTLICKEQVLLKVEELMAESTADVPDEWRRIADRMFTRMTRRVDGGRLKIAGKVRVVRSIGRPPHDAMQSQAAMVEEVLSNGPVERPMATLGNVVSFKRG